MNSWDMPGRGKQYILLWLRKKNQKQLKIYEKLALNSNKNLNSTHKKIETIKNDSLINNYLKQAADNVKININLIPKKNSDY